MNSGYEIPILGIGTYVLSSNQAENTVYWALREGFRLIDTAKIYGNEDGVGRGIRRAISEGIVTRKEIFVTTKMWTSDFDRLVNQTTIRPALLQNEVHPYHQDKLMTEHIAQYGIVMESWFSIGGKDSLMWGSTKNKETLFNDPTIARIAKEPGKTPAQVILRWHLQDGYVAIPGSSSEAHIIEDIDIFDFELTADDMADFKALEQNDRFSGY